MEKDSFEYLASRLLHTVGLRTREPVRKNPPETPLCKGGKGNRLAPLFPPLIRGGKGGR
jgi:hypothetical protein